MPTTSSRTRLVFCWTVGLCAVLLMEVWGSGGGLIRLPLPIAMGTGFPLPLLFWSSIAVYTRWYGSAFRLSREAQWARGLRMGFSLHALALLASLAWPLMHERSVGLSVWYLRYWKAVWAAGLVLSLAGAWRWVARWRAARTVDPFLYTLPLLVGVAAFWAHAALVAPRLALGAAIVGGAFLAGSGVPPAQSWGARLAGWWRDERVFLALVWLIALAFRVFYTTRVMTNPDYWNTGSDGPAYDALAQALLHGGTTPWSHIPLFAPGYVRFLAAIYWVVGRNYFIVCAVQSVLGAAVCVLMYAVAKRLFDATTARIAAVFGAVNFPMIFSATAIGHQAVDLLWTLAVVWCLIRYMDDPRRWGRWMAGIGLLLGWAAATREGNIVFWLLLIGYLALGMRAAVGRRTVLLHVLALSAGFLAVLTPFLLEHGAGVGGGIRGRISAQWFFYQNSSTPINTWFNPWRDPAGARALFHEQPWTVVMKLGEAVAGNFNAVFLNQGFGGFDLVFLARGTTYYYVMWWYAYALAFYGFWLVARQFLRAPRQRLGQGLVLLVLIARALPHLILEGTYRHRAPMEPYLIMLAAYGLTRLLAIGRPSPLNIR